ncbi:CybS-domain-containing protein [Jimgerdemannia flammicorona]|uniref:Succinate dehydrogenase [ubiquinone] cytochrome b small subunit n=1 Tax=Jimgerdemannia flammicorona TaxID=994334 RepID=A0A433QTB9_9FUNG|nr:CybS-domain-containing protein [Jimgerdemannia flammicorona]
MMNLPLAPQSEAPKIIDPTQVESTKIDNTSMNNDTVCMHTVHHAIVDNTTFPSSSRHNPVYRTAEVTFPTPDPVQGSYLWTFERSLSIALVPLTAAQIVVGAHPLTDALLGVVLPLHCHLGMDAVITDLVQCINYWFASPTGPLCATRCVSFQCPTDYLPERRNARLHKVASWGMRLATVGVLIGCYNINTEDVGMTELIKKVWSA